MYTLEQKQLVVDTYLKIGSVRKTIRNLVFPGSRFTLQKRIDEYNDSGYVLEPKRKTPKPCYIEEEIAMAVEY